MEYALELDAGPSSIPGGTGILLLHPSTGGTDQVDTAFLKSDTDWFLVISTRTTAREIQQKLDHYGVDADRAVIIDTLSVERGYSRRPADSIFYLSSPSDLDGLVEKAAAFFERTDGKRRISVDSVTEMAYYADEDRALTATEELLDLLGEHDAIGLFHLAPEVHDPDVVAEFRGLFDGIVTVDTDGTITWTDPDADTDADDEDKDED